MGIFLRGNKLRLRSIRVKDLETLWELIYSGENPEWKKWDAPYWPLKMVDFNTYKNQMEPLIHTMGKPESKLLIEVNGIIIGLIMFYWEDEKTKWLEIGIVIYKDTYWNGGFGTEALALYSDYLFNSLDIGRVGLTTWSGNTGMIRAAEKAGFTLEGRMRKCRYYNGVYYDSIRMGLIREEWKQGVLQIT
ncbi:GNAT family N-acetyltransferase [Peribacillus deserti]|uniref:N-acetyltransferase n=1 Tax=Peribacillus deserti TaxID=673318 RepID=A0A2N5M2C6_9BACI|nr:GNAT family protein [Peribacillus deserti]PLT28526.1 N-acetyltransferase [Peribacillus deserti]